MVRALSIALAIAFLGMSAPPLSAAKSPSKAAALTLDPAAVAALEKMSAYVASLPGFTFDAAAGVDVVAGNGQTVEIGITGHYVAKRPDKLKVDLTTDVQQRTILYDGKNLTMVSPKEGYFATVPAKPTIHETLDWLAKIYAVELPLADLFNLGTPDSPIKNVRGGFFVGKATVNGVESDHWAFQSADHDWEIWIRSGDKPLPLKFQMVDRRDSARPRYHSTITWNEGAAAADDVTFAFTPSSDQKPIEFFENTDAMKGAKP